jgi:hypothetical protein
VEGQTVTLTLFYTKNNPPNSLRIDFNIQTSGSATVGVDYVVTPDPASVFMDPDGVLMDEVSLTLVPVTVNVTLVPDDIGGEGTEDIVLTLVQLPPFEPERVLVNPTVRIIVEDNDREQGEVVWEMGMVGVTEGSGSVEVCANYTEAVEGFTVETSTTEVFALNGSDFLAQIGPSAHLVWNAGSTIACVSIPIIDDERVENDEIFYVNMVRIVNSPSGDDPRLVPLAIIMIMDDDLIPIVFTVDSIVTTDDQPAVEACLEVDNELVDENVAYRIPIAVETQDGTARSDVDFMPLNNMTGGEASRGLLTPPSPSRCFTVSLLTRQDNQLDDRNFFLAVMLIDGARINPLPEQIQLPADLEITIQPAAQIEVGDISDSVLSNPLFSVTLDMKAGDDDSYLCYEVHGDSGLYLNLVSDTCFSINAGYETIEGAPTYNKIDALFITTSDAAGGCSNIEILSSESCTAAYLVGSDYSLVLRERYRRNGVQVEFLDGRIEVTLPCQRYPGGGIKVVVKCNAEYQNPVTEEMLPVKNLDLTFRRGKLASDAYPMPHGLLGQFWRLDFEQEPFRQQFVDGNSRENAFVMTTPVDLGVRSFVGIMYHLTWDLREKQCLYAGSRQAGTSRYVTSPADSVIEGLYQQYSVSGRFGTDYQYSVFPRNDFNCPTP